MNKFVSFLLILFFINGSFVTAFSPVSASNLAEDSWNTKTPMSQARTGLGVVAIGDKIYAIGGQTNDNYVGTNERYEPATDTWVTLASMPTPRFNFAIVAFDGKIYCIGGCSSDNILWSSTNFFSSAIEAKFFSYAVEIYDPITDSWSAKSALPFNGSSQAHVVNGKIYVLSNSGDLHRYGDLYMYDPVMDSWIKKTSIPKEPHDTGFAFASEYLISATINNEILFTGLFSYNQEAIMYNPETDVWRQIANPQFGLFFNSAIATTGVYAPQKIYALGVSGNRIYDPVKDTWSMIKNIDTYQQNFGVAVVDDLLYVIGGYIHVSWGVREVTSLNEQYIPQGYKGAVPTPTSVTPQPSNSTTSESTDPSEPNPIFIITLLSITVGAASSLILYFNKRKRGLREI